MRSLHLQGPTSPLAPGLGLLDLDGRRLIAGDTPLFVPKPLNRWAKLVGRHARNRFDRLTALHRHHAALAPIADALRRHLGADLGQAGREVGLAVSRLAGSIESFHGSAHAGPLSNAETYYGKGSLYYGQQGAPVRSSVRFAFMGNNQTKPDAADFAARLNSVLDDLDVPGVKNGRSAWLVRKFKVSKPTASGWVNGEFIPMPERVRTIAKLGKVNFDWLYFGTGPRAGERFTEPAPTRAVNVTSASQLVRDDSLTLALTLTAEALGRDLYLPPAQHTELVLTILDLLEAGLPQADIIPLARRMSERKAHQGGTDHADERERDKAKGADR